MPMADAIQHFTRGRRGGADAISTLIPREILTDATGTWTPPLKTRKVMFDIIGRGGNGAGSTTGRSGAGGAGATVLRLYIDLDEYGHTPGDPIDFAIGTTSGAITYIFSATEAFVNAASSGLANGANTGAAGGTLLTPENHQIFGGSDGGPANTFVSGLVTVGASGGYGGGNLYAGMRRGSYGGSQGAGFGGYDPGGGGSGASKALSLTNSNGGQGADGAIYVYY